MKRKLLVIIAGVATVIGALSWGAYAHRGHGRHGVEWVAKRLNLDEQQKVKLEAIHQAIKQARQEFRNERTQLFDEIVAQIESNQLDQTKVLQLFEQRQAALSQVAPQIVARVAELHATLTPEQKTKVIDHLERMRERMQHHHDESE
ncbi:MAG: periplasmic heavy metal sensor [Deltaproteobacteria bacterium]|nr:periplasmic heavy metal sensor [Deltaproteobacteria bacterium]